MQVHDAGWMSLRLGPFAATMTMSQVLGLGRVMPDSLINTVEDHRSKARSMCCPRRLSSQTQHSNPCCGSVPPPCNAAKRVMSAGKEQGGRVTLETDFMR